MSTATVLLIILVVLVVLAILAVVALRKRRKGHVLIASSAGAGRKKTKARR